MLKLSIIGCGNVAKTLAFLWHQAGKIEIYDVVNRSQESANESIAFIGAGKALNSLYEIRPADIFIIGCGDDNIEFCLDELLKQNVLQANTIVFHLSGAKSSAVLYKAKTQGAYCASLHPVKSFTNPTADIKSFSGIYCGLEGDESAIAVLEKLVEMIGGNYFEVDSDKKLSYHSASVFACNYMTALQELSIRAFQQSGVERDLAMKIIEPIVKETAENIFNLGTVGALTGPIARGDHQLLAEQFVAVKNWDTDAAEIYRLLGKIGIDLSDKKGLADKSDLATISKLFE